MMLRPVSISLRSVWSCVLVATAIGAAALLNSVDAAADATSANTNAANPNAADPAKATTERKPGKGALPAYTPEREAAALTFVNAHHPELTPLLAGLKSSRPNEYQRAIRKLFADSERLAQSREAQPKMYELKLQEWKLESRIQLLVARLTMGRTPALEAELRAALEEQLTVHRDLLVQERERAQQKIVGLDREISAIDADREKAVTERFNRALSSAGQKKQNAKPGDAKSGESKNSEPKKATP